MTVLGDSSSQNPRERTRQKKRWPPANSNLEFTVTVGLKKEKAREGFGIEQGRGTETNYVAVHV